MSRPVMTRTGQPVYFFWIDQQLPPDIALILFEVFWSALTVEDLFEFSDYDMIVRMQHDSRLTVEEMDMVMHVVKKYRLSLTRRTSGG